MALATVEGNPYGLAVDSRFRCWGKLVRGLQDINLAQKNGYSLTGPFAQWGEVVVLEPGQDDVRAGSAADDNELGLGPGHERDWPTCRRRAPRRG